MRRSAQAPDSPALDWFGDASQFLVGEIGDHLAHGGHVVRALCEHLVQRRPCAAVARDAGFERTCVPFTSNDSSIDAFLETTRRGKGSRPRKELASPLTAAPSQPSFPMIPVISSALYARSVVVRMLPPEPIASRKAVPVSSSGNWPIETMSYGPTVQ